MIKSLGARVHLYVRPEYRERFIAMFADVLGCQLRELDFGLAHPVALVMFGDRSAFSVEFTDGAQAEPRTRDCGPRERESDRLRATESAVGRVP